MKSTYKQEVKSPNEISTFTDNRHWWEAAEENENECRAIEEKKIVREDFSGAK